MLRFSESAPVKERPTAPEAPARTQAATRASRRRRARRPLLVLAILALLGAAAALWLATGAGASAPAPDRLTATHGAGATGPTHEWLDGIARPDASLPWAQRFGPDPRPDPLSLDDTHPPIVEAEPEEEPIEEVAEVAEEPVEQSTDEPAPEPSARADAASGDRAERTEPEERSSSRGSSDDGDGGGSSSGGSSSSSASVAQSLTPATTGWRGAGLSESNLQRSGTITTSSHGQVIENVDVDGGIRIQHRDVTIRNSRVRHSGGYGISDDTGGNVGNLRIINVEVDGRGVADGIGILINGPVQVSRAHIHGQRVGMQLRSGSSVVESYIHNQAVASGTHNTAMSSHGAENLTIRNNRLESSTSASLSLYPRVSPIRNVTVEGNLFEGGGRGIGLYAGYTSNHPYRDQNRDIRIIDNRWTGSFQHGTHLAWNGSQPGNVWRGNRWADGREIGG